MALCPHCNAPLSTYVTSVDADPKDVQVLVCAQCDKVLGVLGTS